MREGDPQSERSEAFFEGKEREEDPQCGRDGVYFLGVWYRLVVPQSRGPVVSSSRGFVVSWSYWRATQAFSVILSHSQAFPVNRAPSSRPAVSSSRSPIVP